MKLFRTFLLFALPLAVLSACKEKEEEPKEPTYFGASLSTDHPNASETSIVVSVLCDLEWTAELEDSSWGSIVGLYEDDGHNGKFTLRLGFNAGGERSNTVILKSGSQEIRKPFTQAGVDELFSAKEINLRSTETAKISFTPGVDWTASVTEGQEWLSIQDPASGAASTSATLLVSATEDFVDTGTRSGKVTVVFGGSDSVDIPVTQYQKDAIILSATEQSADCFPEEFSVIVSSNIGFTVESNAEWLQYEQVVTKALDQTEVVFTVANNKSRSERVGKVRFCGESESGSVNAVLTVTQAGLDPIVDKKDIGFYSVSGTDYVPSSNRWILSSLSHDSSIYDFRMISIAGQSVYALEGIPGSVEDGEACTLTLRLTDMNGSVSSKELSCRQLAHDESLRWFKSESGEKFIIKK